MKYPPATLLNYPSGKSYGALLRWHLGWGTHPGCTTEEPNKPWRPSVFYRRLFKIKSKDSADEGSAKRVFFMWANPDGAPPQEETVARDIELILFDDDPNLWTWRDHLRHAWKEHYDKDYFVDEPKLTGELDGPAAPQHKAAQTSVKFDQHSDAVGHLGAYELDRLPVGSALTIHSVSYGEGSRIISIPGGSLRWLPIDVKQINDAGKYGGPSRFLPRDLGDLSTAEETTSLFLPRYFRVSVSCNEVDCGVQLYVCTDMPYGNFPNYPAKWPFSLNGVLGQGGIAAFVDRWGKLHPRNSIGLGGELGCAALVTVVAFRGREAIYRTPYFVVVRKGIRYPDDRWRSTETGGPIISPAQSMADARFVFQSWESAGQSKDLFVADFNGLRMCNLNEYDETALETFEDDEGREVIRWIDKDRIQFWTYAGGNGFGEIVIRRDCAAV